MKDLKTTAQDMETKVVELEQKMNSLTNSMNSISSTMEPKAQKIQDLGAIHVLFTKLNVIIDMPMKLNELLEQKQYADAVSFYSRAFHLFEKLKHVEMFKQIQDECHGIMSQVGTRIQKKVFSGQGTLVQLCEGFGLLVGLKVMPASDLGKQFLYRSTVFLDALLKKEAVPLLEPEEASKTDSNFTHFEKFSKFHLDYLDQMSMFVDCYDSFFLSKKELQKGITGLEALKQSCFASEMTDQERTIAKDDLIRILNEKQDAYFSFLDTKLQTPKNCYISPNQYVIALTNLRKEVSSAVPLRKFTNLDQRLSQLTMIVLNRIIQGIFGKVNQDFILKIDEFSSETMFNMTRLMTNWIKEALIAKALPILEDFINSESTHDFGLMELLVRIKEALVQFWGDLANQMMKRQPNQPFLVFSRLSFEWSKGVVEAVFSMYQQRLFISKSGGIYSPALSEQEIAKVTADTCAFFNTLSKKLASRFVQDKMLLYTYKIKEYSLSPLLIDQVTMVSTIWRQILQDLDTIQTVVKSAYKNEEKKPLGGKLTVTHSKRPSVTPELGRSKTSSHKVSQTLFDKVDPLMSTLDKLFDERMAYLPQQLELKTAPIVGSLVKCILKCLLEFVRLKSYTCKEYNQIQVDVAYIRLNFWEYVDEKSLNGLCDEILVSAELLGVDISPLDTLV
jgi:hypothetical protein